jgi:hypothetical protein
MQAEAPIEIGFADLEGIFIARIGDSRSGASPFEARFASTSEPGRKGVE